MRVRLPTASVVDVGDGGHRVVGGLCPTCFERIEAGQLVAVDRTGTAIHASCPGTGAQALAHALELAARCPSDPTAASYHHAAARADACTGAPTTAEGRNLLATARPWGDGVRVIGECVCGSSFLFTPATPGDGG